MKSTILAVVGPSGCGKTAMANFLSSECGIPTIVSYTTRQIRDGEIEGKDHYFVTDNDIPCREKMLAYTMFGGFYYWSSIDQVPDNGACVYVVDEKGLLHLLEYYYDTFRIVPILIQRDMSILESEIDRDRLMRDNGRVHIDRDIYDAVIQNNGSLHDFYENITNTLKTLL